MVNNFIKGWSKTRSNITLSSAEAELLAMCKLAAEVIGIGSLAADLGKDLKALLYADLQFRREEAVES